MLEITPVALAVHRVGTNPIIGEGAICIERADEGGGVFFRITSAGMVTEGLRLDPDELGALHEAGKRLVDEMI
jgi:hypothetical protein